MEKLCRRCLNTLPAASFNKDKSRKDGLQNYCKPCSQATVRLWSAKNRERKLEAHRQYDRDNREALNEARRKRILADPEKARQKSSEFCREHREKRAETHSKWVKNNPDKVKKWRDANRAKINERSKIWREQNAEKFKLFKNNWKYKNPGYYPLKAAERRVAHATQTIELSKKHRSDIKAIYASAKKLTLETGIEHHVDHIIPLSAKAVCGLHVPWNLQILDWRSNLSKGNRVDLSVIQPLQPQSD